MAGSSENRCIGYTTLSSISSATAISTADNIVFSLLVRVPSGRARSPAADPICRADNGCRRQLVDERTAAQVDNSPSGHCVTPIISALVAAARASERRTM